MPRDVDVGHRGLELIVDLLGRSRVPPRAPHHGVSYTGPECRLYVRVGDGFAAEGLGLRT